MDDDRSDTKGAKRRRSLGKIGGSALGNAMAGMEDAMFGRQPPPHEIVADHRHRGPVATGDGKLVIALPEDIEPPTTRDEP